jgi:hypothetical protein
VILDPKVRKVFRDHLALKVSLARKALLAGLA